MFFSTFQPSQTLYNGPNADQETIRANIKNRETSPQRYFIPHVFSLILHADFSHDKKNPPVKR